MPMLLDAPMVLVLDMLLLVEPLDMLEQAANKLIRPAPRMILNMMMPRRESAA